MSTKKIQILGSFGSNIEVDSTLTQVGKAADAKATGDAINKVQTNIDDVVYLVENLDNKYYTESEIDGMMSDLNATIDSKSDVDHVHDGLYYTETEIDDKLDVMQSAIDSKVDAVDGMGLSTNDYTTAEKDKLETVEDYANFYEHPAHDSHDSGLYKVTVDGEGHVSNVALVEKEDIVALGIPAQDTTYEEEISDLSDRIDDVENNINTINETLEGVAQDFENYKTTNNEAISTNASAIEANKTAIEAIQNDYLTSANKEQLEDEISKVSEKATANASAIEVLNGEGDGSVKQSIDNAFNEFAANVTNDDVVNTYKELIDYAATHGPEFTELVGKVDTIDTHVGEVKTDLSNYKTVVSDQFTEVDTTINNHVTNTNNPHGVTKDQIGLANIDNTSDIEKPISNATQEALDGKADVEHVHSDLYYDKDEIEELVTVDDIDDICGSNVIVDSGNSSVVSYATKRWVQDGYQPKGNYLTSVPDGYATESYVDTKISAIQTADVPGQINAHNLATDAHNDIRLLVNGLTTRLNTLADCDNTTLDQMSEVVEYIKSNQSLIEGITTKKVNVADIIDNLTTNVSNKPLSASQGVVLKGLIDELISNLSNYQPKGDYLTAVPAGYATEEFVKNQAVLYTAQTLTEEQKAQARENIRAAIDIYDIVSPEMFGAVGDGVTDDSQAFINAFLSGKKVVCDSTKSYYFSKPIDVRTLTNGYLDGNNAYFINFHIYININDEFNDWRYAYSPDKFTIENMNFGLRNGWGVEPEGWQTPLITTGSGAIIKNIKTICYPYVLATVDRYIDFMLCEGWANAGDPSVFDNYDINLDTICCLNKNGEYCRYNPDVTGASAGDGWRIVQCNEYHMVNYPDYNFMTIFQRRPLYVDSCIQSSFAIHHYSQVIFTGCHWESSFVIFKGNYLNTIKFVNCFFYNNHILNNDECTVYDTCSFAATCDTKLPEYPLSYMTNNLSVYDMKCKFINCWFGGLSYIDSNNLATAKNTHKKTYNWRLDYRPLLSEKNFSVMTHTIPTVKFDMTGDYVYDIYLKATSLPKIALDYRKFTANISDAYSIVMFPMQFTCGGYSYTVIRTSPDGNLHQAEYYQDPNLTNDRYIAMNFTDYGLYCDTSIEGENSDRLTGISTPWVAITEKPSFTICESLYEANGVLVTNDNSDLNFGLYGDGNGAVQVSNTAVLIPKATTSDNNKVLTVVDGSPIWSMSDESKSVPACSESNNGQFLRVVNGAAAWSTIPNAEEASF